MNKDDFQQGMADYDMAINATSLSQVEEAAPAAGPDALTPPPSPPEGEQVAGVGTKMMKGLFGDTAGSVISKNSKTLVQNRPPKPNASGIEDVEKVLTEYTKDKVTKVNGIEDIESPEQIDELMEVVGSAKFPDRRSWDEIRAKTNTVTKVMKELRPITEGRQTGPLSDVQLHGVSRIISTAYSDVERLLSKVDSPEATPEDLIALANAKSTYEVMYSYLKGQGGETARALNSLKMTGEALKTKDFASYEKMTSGEQGTKLTKYVKQWADSINNRIEKGDSIGKAMEWTTAALKSDYIRIGVEFWKNNQLSGLKTHVVNNASVAAHLMYENVIIRPTAAAVGAVRTGGRKDVDRVQASEMLAPLYSSYAGVRGYLGLFWDNVANGKRAFDSADKVEDSGALSDKIADSGLSPGVKKSLDVATSASFKLLTASDEANRGIAFTQELYARSARQASREGLSGEAHLKRMDELLNDPPLDMYTGAMDHAAQMTFTDVESKGWIASMSKSLRVMTGEIPPLQFIIPYINTPSRLLHVATEMSPLAPLSRRLREDVAAGGAKADIAIAKMTAGIGMGLTYWQLYEAGILTGGGPEDYQAQNMLRQDGWQPWGIKVDDKVYGMERMDPFAKSAKFTEGLATFVGYMDKAKYAATPEDKEKYMSMGILHMTNYIMEDQWLEQASGFIKMLEGSDTMEKYLARTAAGFIPYHAAFKSWKEFQDPAKRQLSQDSIHSNLSQMFQDQIQGNFPEIVEGYGSSYVRPRRNWDGTIFMPEQTQFASGASPFGPTQLESNPLTRELFENGVFPPEPSSILTLGPKKFSLLELDESGKLYDIYINIVGEEREKLVIETVTSDEYLDSKQEYGVGPNSVPSVTLRKAISVGKKAGTERFLEELKNILVENPKLATPVATMLAMEPEDLINYLADNPSSNLLQGPVKFDQSRGPLEYPIPEMK